MKSITIHGLEEPLWALIKSKAQFEGQSLNKTLKSLIEKALGVSSPKNIDRRTEFEEFLGCWSKKELDVFSKNIADMEKIEKGDWL